MDESRLVFLMLDAVGVLSTFLVLIASAIAAFQLTKMKQGAGGGWLLVLARTGVWVVGLGYLGLNLASAEIGLDAVQVVSLLLRTVSLVCYLGTIAAFLMMRPSREVGHG